MTDRCIAGCLFLRRVNPHDPEVAESFESWRATETGSRAQFKYEGFTTRKMGG
jgi:hypothetical protein